MVELYSVNACLDYSRFTTKRNTHKGVSLLVLFFNPTDSHLLCILSVSNNATLIRVKQQIYLMV